MKSCVKLQQIINNRLEFIEKLFLISSYKQLVTPDIPRLIMHHNSIEYNQSSVLGFVLHKQRINETFKKQIHAIFLKTFGKLKANDNFRVHATGHFSDIIEDCLKFYVSLKQKQIVQLIKDLISQKINNKSKMIYILFQLLLKFLRVKSLDIINHKISIHQQNFQTYQAFNKKMNKNEDRKISKRYCLSAKESLISSNVLLSKNQQKYDKKKKVSVLRHTSLDLKIQSRQESRKNLRSVSIRKNSIGTYAEQNQLKRKIIRSFQDVKNETKEKIKNSIQSTKVCIYSSSSYHRLFQKVYKQQWSEYQILIGMNDEQLKKQQPVVNFFQKTQRQIDVQKKWYVDNIDKLLSESCSRNESIRREMQNYFQLYTTKYK